MPFRSTLYIDHPPEMAIKGADVVLVLPTGERKITIRTSRHDARLFAFRLGKMLDEADRSQVVEFRRGDGK